MTTTHSLAERLRARATSEDITAERGHATARTPHEVTVAMQHEHAAAVLREEAAALDALTPDPALGEVEREDALADIIMGALNDAHKAAIDNEIDEQAVVDAFLVRFRKLGWQPTTVAGLRREVAERIAVEVQEECAARALDQIERRMKQCDTFAKERPADAEHFNARAIECSGLSVSVRVAIGPHGTIGKYRNLPEIPEYRQLRALDLAPILDKHLSADDEERAAERAAIDALLAWGIVDGGPGTIAERSARLMDARDVLRAVRARRKTT